MAKRFQLLDLDEYMENLSTPVTILNDLPSETQEDRDAIDQMLMVTYDKHDVLSVIPTCGCGVTKLGQRLGQVCSHCGTPVIRPSESTLNAAIWMRASGKNNTFFSPIVWLTLTGMINSKGYNLLEWLTNPYSNASKATKKTHKRIAFFTNHGWKRGLTHFREHIDEFLHLIETMPDTPPAKRREIINYINLAREYMFPRHLPMPTKTLIVLENTAVSKFAELSITGAIDASKTVIHCASIERNSPGTLTQKWCESKSIAVVKNMSKYYQKVMQENLTKKKGWMRGQIYSGRSHFCARGVITSISEPHHYEDFHISWGQGLELFKIHILNKLLKLGYTAKRALDIVDSNGAVVEMTPERQLLSSLMKEIMAEHPSGKGFPGLIQRNPSLTRASAQLVYICVVKEDVLDKTMGLSILILKGPNADFDGDETNLTLILSADLWEKAKLLRPHYAIHDLINLGKLNNNCLIPDVALSVWGNYLNSRDYEGKYKAEEAA